MQEQPPRLSWSQFYLQLAQFVAQRSKDPSTKCGCVLVRSDNRIAAIGYNGPLPGMPDTTETLKDRPSKYLWCEHAERNAVYSLDGKLAGGTAFVTGPPCADCARALISCGVAKVIYPVRHNFREKGAEKRWADSVDAARRMFLMSRVEVWEIETDPAQVPERIRAIEWRLDDWSGDLYTHTLRDK